MKPRKSKIMAFLLALFGGWIGLHRFYLGETGAGIFFIMLFMFTSFIRFPVTAFIGLIDAFRLLMMPPKEFDRRYNRGAIEDHRNRSKVKNKDVYVERQRQSSAGSASRANPYKKTASQKFKDYEVRAAIDDYVKSLDIAPNDPESHYMLAQAYSMEEEAEKSLYHLQKSLENGFRDFDKIESIDNLAFLRIQPDFEALKESGYRSFKSISKPKGENLLDDDILLSQLNKLAELRNKGLLSEAEFVMEKQKLMNK